MARKTVSNGVFKDDGRVQYSVNIIFPEENEGVREFSFRFDGPVPMIPGAEASIVVTSIKREVVEK